MSEVHDNTKMARDVIQAYRSGPAFGAAVQVAAIQNILKRPLVGDERDSDVPADLAETLTMGENHWRLTLGLLSVVNQLLMVREHEVGPPPSETMEWLGRIQDQVPSPPAPD